MGKIKEINLLTTDGSWWKLCDDANSTMDETIVNKLLVQMSVKAGKWFDGGNEYDFTGKPMYINTSNIIAVEVIRESMEQESRTMTKRRVEKEKQQHDCDTCTYGKEIDEYTEVFTAKQLDTLAQARKIYGGKNQVTVAAEECCELAKELLKAIRYEDFNEAVVHTKKDVLAEVADVLIVMDHVLKLYNITASDLQPQIEYKLNRLQQWLNDSNSIEYTTELREV